MSVNLADEAPEARTLEHDPALFALGLDAKVAKYERLIEESLHPRLEAVVRLRDKLYEDMAEGTKLKNFVEKNLLTKAEGEPLLTKVDLGHHFYATAEIADTRSILVDIGLGLYVKHTPEEAIAFLTRREQHLEEQCKEITARASRIKVEIKVVFEAIASLAEAKHLESQQTIKKERRENK